MSEKTTTSHRYLFIYTLSGKPKITKLFVFGFLIQGRQLTTHPVHYRHDHCSVCDEERHLQRQAIIYLQCM